MIKSQQIEDIQKEDFHYITSITKPQIECLLKKDIIQYSLFDNEIAEVESSTENCRYIFRKNPVRSDEIKQIREGKLKSLQEYINKQNIYLKEHKKAQETVALRKVEEKIQKLNIQKWVKPNTKDRVIKTVIDQQEKQEIEKLDGCYCIKTDIPKKEIDAKTVHDRYKDLIWVENAFRTSKTVQLELRPIYTVREETTRGHVCVVMLAYMIVQSLQRAWSKQKNIDITPEEGIKRLQTLCTTQVHVKDQVSFHQITKPNKQTQSLLDALDISLPTVFPKRKIHVDTRKKLKCEKK